MPRSPTAPWISGPDGRPPLGSTPTMLVVTASKNLNDTTDPPRRKRSNPDTIDLECDGGLPRHAGQGMRSAVHEGSSLAIPPPPWTANVEVPAGVEKFIDRAPCTTIRQLRGASPSA